MNSSTAFAIEHLQLPVRNVVAGIGRGEFYASGAILQVTTDPAHPVMAGMPPAANVFFARSPVFSVDPDFASAAKVT